MVPGLAILAPTVPWYGKSIFSPHEFQSLSKENLMGVKLTWLHLSDLHMEKEDLYDRGVVIKDLLTDLQRLRLKGVVPDFVVFTGDITRHGKEDEYTLAEDEFFCKMLKVLQLDAKDLIVAPGNHDVQDAVRDQLQNPLDKLKSNRDVTQFFGPKQSWEIHLEVFNDFTAFAKSHTICASQSCRSTYADVHEIMKDKKRIAVVILNSAVLSRYNKNIEGEVEDYGHLTIGERQALTAFEKTKGADLVITLIHHPFHWLLPFEQRMIEEIVTDTSDFILVGHLHDVYTCGNNGRSGRPQYIRAGSVFNTRATPNAYNMVEMDLDSLQGRIIYRRWFNEARGGGKWSKDIVTTGEEKDGVEPFILKNNDQDDGMGRWIPASADMFTLTDTCRQNIAKLGMTEDHLIELVRNEFLSHANYLKYDQDATPMPVRGSYIVIFNKRGSNVVLHNVTHCTRNDAAMSSWSVILTLYRQAARLAYRRNPDVLIQLRSHLPTALAFHQDIRTLMVKHFGRFRDMDVSLEKAELERFVSEQFPGAFAATGTEAQQKGLSGDQAQMAKGQILFGLGESLRACKAALETQELIKSGNIEGSEGIRAMTPELERSLQHLHKIILDFPPV